MEDIKIRRLGWAGHIIRMEEERIPKKVLNGNFYTTRPVGRPRNRWADVVQKDALQLLGIRGWRRRAEIGMNGGVLWGRPRPGRGCSAIYGMEFALQLKKIVEKKIGVHSTLSTSTLLTVNSEIPDASCGRVTHHFCFYDLYVRTVGPVTQSV